MFNNDFDKGFWREFLKMGTIALVMNVLFWGALAAIVLIGLNIAGVI